MMNELRAQVADSAPRADRWESPHAAAECAATDWQIELLDLKQLNATEKAALAKRWKAMQKDGFQWLGSAGSDWARVTACGFSHVLVITEGFEPVLMTALRMAGPRVAVSTGESNLLSLYPALVCKDGESARLLGPAIARASDLGLDGLEVGPLPQCFLDQEVEQVGQGTSGLVTPLPDQLDQLGTVVGRLDISATGTVYCLNVEMTGSEQKLSKNARKSMRRSEKALRELGELGATWTDCRAPQFNEVVTQLLDWKSQWLENKAYWGGGLRSQRVRRELDQLLASGHRNIGVHSLLVGGRPVAHLLVLTPRRVVDPVQTGEMRVASGLISASSPEMEAASPAKVHMNTIKNGHGFEQPLSGLDLFQNHGQYKTRLGARPVELYRLTYTNTQSAAIRLWSRQLQQAARTKVRERLERRPLWVRRRFVALLSALSAQRMSR